MDRHGLAGAHNHDVIITGDTHGCFGELNMLMNKQRPALVIVCGDMGYWPRVPASSFYGRSNPNYPRDKPAPKVPDGCRLLWCDGNHEDHESLRARTTDALWPRTRYMPRGSTYDLPDGRTILFMGGALSIDKHNRRVGIDWFPEEQPDYADLAGLPDPETVTVDIIVSHTCPREFNPRVASPSRERDWTRDVLSELRRVYRPCLWYCGHWHTYTTEYIDGCRFTCLDMAGDGGRWWCRLPD